MPLCENGGGRWIRTTEPNRELIYSQPRLTTSLALRVPIQAWCRREDLNPQPTDYKSVALPIELQRPEWWLGTESNRRHEDFQSSALPTELPSLMYGMENGGTDGIRTRDLLRDRQAC